MTAPCPPSGHFTLLYFAAAYSYTRRHSEYFEAPMKATELFATLESRYPGIKTSVLDSCALTVNREYVNVEENSLSTEKICDTVSDIVVIHAGDEVAIIPPVSSG
ncbi:hypothetical protein EV356DRAFT_509217 [Viridothelium virens]|uniref:Molybdopterin synthase sulfur carrier subunit n=1 Tax=Viridothelium virens TaxID=1048519 RepID=A0A6A6GXF7_VIRVR|nr:hypothetical protein EV356DRAFT_509217 [Viridothelium virens]